MSTKPYFVENPSILKRNKKPYILSTIKNPLLDELKDNEIKKLSEKSGINFIPFLDGSDANLALFRKLSELSTTHGSTISRICSYAFDGGFLVKKQPIPGIKTKFDNSVSELEEQLMVDFVLKFTTFDNLLNIAKRLGKNYKTYGNAILELGFIDIGGIKKIDIICHDVENFRYFASINNDDRIGLISPKFDSYYLLTNEPRVIPMYPNFDTSKKGVKRTLIHIKNDVVGRPYYGLPNSVQSLNYQFLEYQQGKYTIEGYANDWTAKVFLEISVPSMDEDNDSDTAFSDNLHNVFTNNGEDKKTALVRFKPDGVTETKVHEFSSNTNENFHKTMGEIASSKIIESHDWHPILNSKTSGSMGNSNEFENVYTQKYTSVIMPFQETILTPINILLKEASYFFETNIDSLSLGFVNILEDYINLKNQNTNVQNNSNGI